MVTLRENESLDNLIKRFKKEVDDAGILKDWREKQYFVKPSAKRHQKIRTAQRRFDLILIEEKEKEKKRKGR